MSRIVFILATLCFLIECSSNGEKSEIERSRLSQAKAKWENAKALNTFGYVFNSRQICLCALNDNVKITVKADTICSVLDIQSQTYLPDSVFSAFLTIDEWFDWITASLDKNPYSASVKYDENFGYPTELNFDFDEAIVDEELGLVNDSLKFIYNN